MEEKRQNSKLFALTGITILGICIGLSASYEILPAIIVTIMTLFSAILLISDYRSNKLLSSHAFVTFTFLIAFYLNIILLYIIGELEITDVSFINTILLIVLSHISYEMGYRLFSRKYLPAKRITNFVSRIKISSGVYPLILIFSLVGIFSWLKYFDLFGGIRVYLFEGGLAKRVLLSRGYGWLLILANFYNVANTIYFIYVLSIWRNQIKTKKLFKYFATITFVFHTILYFIVFTPFAQRGYIIWKIVIFLIIFHYFFKPLNRTFLVICGCILIIITQLLQTIRSYPGEYAKAFAEIKEPNYITRIIKEGWGYRIRLEAIHEIINNVPDKLNWQLGKTYLSLLTQFIPRKIWPEKLDSGGVVITKEITRRDFYRGTSHDAPTLIGEAYLNFWILGVIAMAIIFGSVNRYIDNLINLWKYYPIGAYLIGIFIMTSPIFLLGEFTNVIFGLIYTVLTITLFLSILRISSSLKPRKMSYYK